MKVAGFKRSQCAVLMQTTPFSGCLSFCFFPKDQKTTMFCSRCAQGDTKCSGSVCWSALNGTHWTSFLSWLLRMCKLKMTFYFLPFIYKYCSFCLGCCFPKMLFYSIKYILHGEQCACWKCWGSLQSACAQQHRAQLWPPVNSTYRMRYESTNLTHDFMQETVSALCMHSIELASQCNGPKKNEVQVLCLWCSDLCRCRFSDIKQHICLAA